ncbi:MAG: hypothetical protein WBB01_16830 [Phormidesmis sp.]
MVDHVRLRGLRAPEIGLTGHAPTVLRRMDDDPIAGVLADLLKPGLGAISNTLVTQFDQPWRFFQPVHRVFHVVLLEAVCDPYEADVDAFQPRLNPLKIDSAGLVMRRYALASREQEGWRTLAGISNNSMAKLRGWIPLSSNDALNRDPDPQRRAAPAVQLVGASRVVSSLRLTTGRPELDRQLSVMQAVENTYSEQVNPLFVAPPEVCQALGKTVLYALVPSTSRELSEAENVESAFDLDFVKSHLPTFLAQTPAADINPLDQSRRLQRPGETEEFESEDGTLAEKRDRAYKEILRQLSDEFELLKNLPTSQALLNSLNQFSVFEGNTARPAGNALKAAAQQFSTEGTIPYLPAAWGAINSAIGNGIANRVKAILDRRIKVAIPQLNRFDELDREYSLRAFVRVKSDDGCPPKLWWSDNSPPFTIRRWYENSPVPPVQVALPDLIGEDFSQLSPNVTFAVPAGLFNAIDGMTLKDLLDGKKPSGGSPALDWICGFNIPIITICAFIVLNIFLQLLNFVFQWLPFIKICVPIPVSQPSQGGNTP